MTFGDDVATGLAELRAYAQTRMRASCTIIRPGAPVTDENGDVTTPSTQIYPDPSWPEDHPLRRGPCYTRYPGLAFEQNADVGGASVVASRIVVRVPFGPICRPGDVVTITADPDNPQMVGARLQVASIDDQSQATAQRLLCVDYQAGVA